MTSEQYVGKCIRIIECWNASPNYKNIIPGTLHVIITPPEGRKNTQQVVYVQGVYEPAIILGWEYEFIKLTRTKFNK